MMVVDESRHCLNLGGNTDERFALSAVAFGAFFNGGRTVSDGVDRGGTAVAGGVVGAAGFGNKFF